MSLLLLTKGFYLLLDKKEGFIFRIFEGLLLAGVITILNVFFVWIFAVVVLFIIGDVFI
jgi:hypothetical protein